MGMALQPLQRLGGPPQLHGVQHDYREPTSGCGMNARRRRDARPALRSFVVTPRDVELVNSVGRMAQATSDQLRRLFFGDPSTASRRLSKLVAMRLLDVHLGNLNEPNVYTLGAKAGDLLERFGRDTRQLHRPRVRFGADVHLRLLNDVRIELVLAARTRSDVELVAFHADLDLRRAAAGTPVGYIPDAVAELVIGVTRHALMLEVDTGTEGSATFREKATATVQLWQAGAKCWGAAAGTWRPIALAPTATRVRALARAIVDAGGSELWLLSEFSVLQERGGLGPVFATAAEAASVGRGAPMPYRYALAPAPTAAAPLETREQ
jgi:hypothetical protein